MGKKIDRIVLIINVHRYFILTKMDQLDQV
jgi:hypothetical protein